MIRSVIKTAASRISGFKNEAIWVLLGQLGMAAGVILSIKILTFVLSPSEFGRLMLANTIIVFIHTNLFGPFTHSLMRFWSISIERQDIHSFDSAAAFYMKAIFILVLIGISGVTAAMILIPNNWELLIMVSLMIGAMSGLTNIRIYIFMAARRQKTAALLNSALAMLKPVSGAVAAGIFASCAETALAGFLAAAAVIWIIAEFNYSEVLEQTADQRTERDRERHYNVKSEILAYAYPFFVWGVFSWIFQFCDRWALQTFYGPEVVGAFAVISQLAVYPLIFFSGFLLNLLLPVAFQKAGNSDSQTTVKSAQNILFIMTGVYVAAAIGLILIYAVCHRLIVTIISNQAYAVFSFLLPWLTAAWALFYLGQILAGFGFLANKPGKYIPPIIASGAAALVFSFSLAPEYGPTGVVWALGISGFIYAAWFLTIAIRFVKP